MFICLVRTETKLKAIKPYTPSDLPVHREKENLCFMFVQQKAHVSYGCIFTIWFTIVISLLEWPSSLSVSTIYLDRLASSW